MTTHRQYGPDESTVHDAAGAYVLGILDDAEATAFEEHLAGCQICALHLEEFSGMEPMLAMLADGAGPFAAPAAAPMSAPVTNLFGRTDDPFTQLPGRRSVQSAPAVSVQPSPQLLDRLVDEVAVKRAKRKRRGMYLVAAAAALIVGGPVAVVATTDGGTPDSVASGDLNPSGSPTAEDFFADTTSKVQATDPTTKVTAVVGTESKGWGTRTVLELKNVKGPEKCSLIAVSKTGDEEVVTSWSVPAWGYGIPGSTNESAKNPLYVHGGTAMKSGDIDHFEVRTFDGKSLVKVAA